MVQPSSIVGNNLIMKRSVPSTERTVSERKALGRRVKLFYRRFNVEAWEACYRLIDPKLTQNGKVELAVYSERMRAFKTVYGSVKPWLTRLSLHLDASPHQRDTRPFAYVYLIWQDEAHEFHMFRDRWVKENAHWYTRVVGLVANRQTTHSL